MIGKFIVFEGIDGSGKSFILDKIYEYLLERKINENQIVKTFEPTKGEFGKKVKEMQIKDKDPLSNAEECFELYLKDRLEHLEKVIFPAVQQGKIVLCDRYKYSTIIYQNIQGMSQDKLLEAHKDLLVPNLVLIFDLDPEKALERLNKDNKRQNTEKFEKLGFLTKVREKFKGIKKIFPAENIVFIDASKSKQDVLEQVKSEIDSFIF